MQSFEDRKKVKSDSNEKKNSKMGTNNSQHAEWKQECVYQVRSTKASMKA